VRLREASPADRTERNFMIACSLRASWWMVDLVVWVDGIVFLIETDRQRREPRGYLYSIFIELLKSFSRREVGVCIDTIDPTCTRPLATFQTSYSWVSHVENVGCKGNIHLVTKVGD
jgi:hypothetical protein